MTPLPDADALLADPALDSGVRRCLARFFAWGAAPTVDGYCDLFAPGGTLLDAGMEQPIAGDEIRASITRVLTLLPDFRFNPVRVVHEGPHAFVHARNRATAAGNALAWEAVYALTVAGDRIGAGRRYYDQASVLGGASASIDDADAATSGTAPRLDLAARAAAWNRGDVAALVAPLQAPRLVFPGSPAPLGDPAAVHRALADLTARMPAPGFTRGAAARTADAVALEWTGTIGGRRFGLVEIVTGGAGGASHRWRLAFDTLGLGAGASAATAALRDQVFAADVSHG